MRPGESQFSEHLHNPRGRGLTPEPGHTGAAGGAACGDLIRITIAVSDDGDGSIRQAGFDAGGCGATLAAGSATVALIEGRPLLEAARIGPEQIADELGGLIAPKRHAAELAADALHRALGAAARAACLDAQSGRALVAMSGGVDSAVAALMAGADGGEAIACTLELWSDPANDGDLSCCSAQAVRGARTVAHGLGMPHFSIDLRAEFRAGVVDGWLSDHAAGLTPNPCIRCNGNVRLDAMLDLGERLGAGTLATGHYARVRWDGDAPLLMTAADLAKDQSYVLSGLAPASLARMRFPLGDLHKDRVRQLAHEAGLAVASRRDSQDLCFLAGTGQRAFLEHHGGMAARPGPIRTLDGTVLGEHAGTHLYTVGQRHGLGIATGSPVYVLSTDAASNTVTVGPRSALMAAEIPVREIVLHRPAGDVDGVRVRAHGRRLACRLPAPLDPGRHPSAAIELHEQAERTAPGQLACLYSGELVVGYGTIAA